MSSSIGCAGTRTPGVPDSLYVQTRAALLDAVEALGDHRNALVLVSAQAVYLTPTTPAPPSPSTPSDVDFTVSPADLADDPYWPTSSGHGFTAREHPVVGSDLMASTSTSWFLKPSLALESAAFPWDRSAPTPMTERSTLNEARSSKRWAQHSTGRSSHQFPPSPAAWPSE